VKLARDETFVAGPLPTIPGIGVVAHIVKKNAPRGFAGTKRTLCGRFSFGPISKDRVRLLERNGIAPSIERICKACMRLRASPEGQFQRGRR
jgi:hypothetical protein